MAGRGTDIKLGGNPEMRARKMVDQEKNPEEYERIYKRELAKCQAEYVTVKELGGLCIIGTERHESRRIDNQLRGRAGRQGDPGYSKFYVSLDDDLMRLFGGERFRSMMARFGMDSGEALQHGLVSKSIERAQKRVEERNYEIRKHLLDYDDVLNRQRLVIYSLRDSMLLDSVIKERLTRTAHELTDELLASYIKDDGHLNEEQRATLGLELWEQLGFEAEDSSTFFHLKLADKRTAIFEFFNADLAHKEELMGSQNFNRFLQFEYLRMLDRKWQEHLETMEGLREAVNLRSYAQRNPLVEYKLEGFQLFDNLLDDMAHLLVARIFKVRLREDTKPQRQQIIRGESKHISMGNTLGQAAQVNKRISTAPHRENRPIITQKVGRNEPCPCGSGKKYKQCHGS
jgi:preprotein translocase subunit SecA